MMWSITKLDLNRHMFYSIKSFLSHETHLLSSVFNYTNSVIDLHYTKWRLHTNAAVIWSGYSSKVFNNMILFKLKAQEFGN